MDDHAKILIIDDEINIIHALKRLLDNKGYELFSATEPDEAMDIIEREKLDLIICDQRFPNSTGIDILKHSIERIPNAIRILITGYSDINVAITAINEGSIFRYVSKPWNNEELIEIVREGIKRKKDSDSNKALLQTVKNNENLAEISDKIKMIQNILEQPPIKKVKPQSTSIPIWDKEEIILMKPSEIYFFAAINGEVLILTKNGKYKSTETLNHWERKVEGMNFFRCHRSYIVNVDKIEKISPWYHGAFNLKLKDVKDSIPVSRNASKGLKEYVDF